MSEQHREGELVLSAEENKVRVRPLYVVVSSPADKQIGSELLPICPGEQEGTERSFNLVGKRSVCYPVAVERDSNESRTTRKAAPFLTITNKCYHTFVKGKKKSMTAHPAHLQFINPPTMASPPGYTHVVEITGGRTVYISGQIAVDQAFRVVGKGDVRAQAEQVFENLQAALAGVGADFTHVVKLNYYLVDMTHLPIIREVRDRYVNAEHPPASTAVEVRKLALDDLLIEIEAVASLPA